MNSVPLADVLPWSDTHLTAGQTILICDSTETDGRFLLHTLASQFIKSHSTDTTTMTTAASAGGSSKILPTSSAKQQRNEQQQQHNKVLWVACGPLTEQLILSALKKIGCDLPISSSYPHDLKHAPKKQVQVINVMLELIELIQTRRDHESGNEEDRPMNTDDEECYEICLKRIYQRIRTSLLDDNRSTTSSTTTSSSSDDSNLSTPVSSSSNVLIILDNVSLLSTFFGPRLVHAFIQKIRALIQKNPACSPQSSSSSSSSSLALLCSHDIDQEQYITKASQEKKNTSVSGGTKSQYIGGGGRGILLDSKELSLLEQNALYELQHGGGGEDDNEAHGNIASCWERHLVELADGIVDVVPLASGFARDVHGRLIFTERAGSGLGWGVGGRGRKNEGQQQQQQQRLLQNKRMHAVKGGKKGSAALDFKPSERGTTFSATIVNYCCTDSGIRAIRLRAGTN